MGGSVDAMLAAVRDVLLATGRVDAAFVFGSVARGQARPESDVDVAVRLLSGPLAPEQRFELLGRLGIAAGRDVHLVDLGTIDAGLRRRIFAEGRVLFDSDPARTQVMKRNTLLEYFDWAYARAVADKRLKERLGKDNLHG